MLSCKIYFDLIVGYFASIFAFNIIYEIYKNFIIQIKIMSQINQSGQSIIDVHIQLESLKAQILTINQLLENSILKSLNIITDRMNNFENQMETIKVEIYQVRNINRQVKAIDTNKENKTQQINLHDSNSMSSQINPYYVSYQQVQSKFLSQLTISIQKTFQTFQNSIKQTIKSQLKTVDNKITKLSQKSILIEQLFKLQANSNQNSQNISSEYINVFERLKILNESLQQSVMSWKGSKMNNRIVPTIDGISVIHKNQNNQDQLIFQFDYDNAFFGKYRQEDQHVFNQLRKILPQMNVKQIFDHFKNIYFQERVSAKEMNMSINITGLTEDCHIFFLKDYVQYDFKAFMDSHFKYVEYLSICNYQITEQQLDLLLKSIPKTFPNLKAFQAISCKFNDNHLKILLNNILTLKTVQCIRIFQSIIENVTLEDLNIFKSNQSLVSFSFKSLCLTKDSKIHVANFKKDNPQIKMKTDQ